MNRCFADVERFMARLQETAEAKNILEQQSIKKKSKKKKSKKKKEQDGKRDAPDDLHYSQACPRPSET